MVNPHTTTEHKSSREEALDLLQGELQQANAELRDIQNKILTSRGQVEQLAHRSAQVMGEVRRREGALDLPQGDIREANAELRVIQYKILASRGQVEQLAQRSAQVMGEVRRVGGALEQTPQRTLREVYT